VRTEAAAFPARFRPNLGAVVACQRLLREWNTVLFGKFFDRLPKRKTLNVHDEGENVALGVAAETAEDAVLRVDRERWRFFVMKRTKSGVAVPEPAQTHVIRDHAHDVDLSLQFLREIHDRIEYRPS
jgi:hypothetical protein